MIVPNNQLAHAGHVVLLAILAIALLVAFPVTAKADTATIVCEKDGSNYVITFDVSASGKRLILVGVIDEEGNGHRVYRYLLKGGTKADTITIPKRRFGELTRACIAVHLTSGNQRTVASDCDYF